jgi:hypothetical protein
VRLLTQPGFQLYRAVVRDISPQGIGLLTEQPFVAGAVLAVLLPRRHTNVSGVLTAQVRRATRLPDGTWLVGCSLSRPLTEKELRTLLEVPDMLRSPAGG